MTDVGRKAGEGQGYHRHQGGLRSDWAAGYQEGLLLEHGDHADPLGTVPHCLVTASGKVEHTHQDTARFFGWGPDQASVLADPDEKFFLPRFRDQERVVVVSDHIARCKNTGYHNTSNGVEIARYWSSNRHFGTTLARTRQHLAGMKQARKPENRKASTFDYSEQLKAAEQSAVQAGVDLNKFFELGGTIPMLFRVAQGTASKETLGHRSVRQAIDDMDAHHLATA